MSKGTLAIKLDTSANTCMQGMLYKGIIVFLCNYTEHMSTNTSVRHNFVYQRYTETVLAVIIDNSHVCMVLIDLYTNETKAMIATLTENFNSVVLL